MAHSYLRCFSREVAVSIGRRNYNIQLLTHWIKDAPWLYWVAFIRSFMGTHYTREELLYRKHFKYQPPADSVHVKAILEQKMKARDRVRREYEERNKGYDSARKIEDPVFMWDLRYLERKMKKTEESFSEARYAAQKIHRDDFYLWEIPM